MTNNRKQYIELKDLEVYQPARELSRMAWGIYETLSWQDKKVIGNQFIRATDSVGANIAEGYGRFHYKDKVKFYYNARASLVESRRHWLELLEERNLVEDISEFVEIADRLSLKLNNFIGATMRAKEQNQ